jgi:chromosome segregation ATPase
MAKSTLLRALQTERSSVHELEASVASLLQNNSAISEIVDSRDMIIDELNDRIAVFEEDKVVLKAALRQLQKEMKEETPKTQKLMDDLASAREGNVLFIVILPVNGYLKFPF